MESSIEAEQPPLQETLFCGYIEPVEQHKDGKFDDPRHRGHILKTRDTLPTASIDYVSDCAIPYWRELIQKYRLAFPIDLQSGRPTGEVGIACRDSIKLCDCLKAETWELVSAWGLRKKTRFIAEQIPESTVDDMDVGLLIHFPSSSLEAALVAAQARVRKRFPGRIPPPAPMRKEVTT